MQVLRKLKCFFPDWCAAITPSNLYYKDSKRALKMNSAKYEPLIKLTEKEMRYVESEWHHACLTAYGLRPTRDNMYNDFDLEDDEIRQIVEKYGKYPPRWKK